MEKIIIDAKGKNCPIPLIMTRKAVKEEKEGFIILIDNSIAKDNVCRYLGDNNIQYSVSQKESVYYIEVGKIQSDTNSLSEINEYSSCAIEPGKTSNIVICIKSTEMGHGDKELGDILLRAFINTIKELPIFPKTLILYNSAIYLATKNSPVLDTLKALKKEGLEILVCGTCTDFYNQQKEISVGIISNMYDISEKLILADNIICP